MPTFFKVGSPSDPEEKRPVEVRPAKNPINDAFSALATAGTPSEGPQPEFVWKPFVGMVKNQQATLRRQQALLPIQDASIGVLDEYIQQGMDVEQAQALTMVQTARRLRQLGYTTEAGQLYNRGLESLKAHRDTVMTREKMIRETENIGDTGLVNEQEERAILEAQLASGDLDEATAYDTERRIGEIDASILKRIAIVGRSPTDLATDKTLMRQQMSDHIADNLLLSRLDQAQAILNETDPSEVSRIAQLDASFSGFLQGWFGFDLSLTQEQNIQKIVNQRGSTSLVAAKIRHSLTGAQMSQFEIQYLEWFLPSPGDPLTTQRAKLSLIRRFIMSDINTRMRMMTDPKFSAATMNIPGATQQQKTNETVDIVRDALATAGQQ
jgi:hypothetical protein